MNAEMIEDYDWESEDAEDWESDEAIGEYEDSAEDIGERARRRRRQKKTPRARAVHGMAVRSQDGGVRNYRFPAPLATATETNRGLATQEVARRALAGRLERLEASHRAQQKKDSSVSGLVTLAIGGSLTAFGAIQASRNPGGSGFQTWAQLNSTKTAAVFSAAQVATTLAKFAINRKSQSSAISITADIYSVVHLAVFAFGSLNTPAATLGTADFAEAIKQKDTVSLGTVIVTQDNGRAFRVVRGEGGIRLLREVS